MYVLNILGNHDQLMQDANLEFVQILHVLDK